MIPTLINLKERVIILEEGHRHAFETCEALLATLRSQQEVMKSLHDLIDNLEARLRRLENS